MVMLETGVIGVPVKNHVVLVMQPGRDIVKIHHLHTEETIVKRI